MVHKVDNARYYEIVSRYPQLLQDKLSHCGELVRNRNHYRCKSPACRYCRYLRGRHEGRAAVNFFSESRNENMILLTVAFDLALDVDEIEKLSIKFKSYVRNLINRERKRSKRWDNVSLYGWFEADPIHICDISIAPQRINNYLFAKLLSSSTEMVWNCHIHAIVDCANVDWQQVRDVFIERWLLPSQVDVQLFGFDISKDENIKKISAYSHKYCYGKLWDGVFNKWNINDIVEYYTMKAKFGWCGNTFKINNKNKHTTNKQVINKVINYDDGMAILF